MIDATCEGDVDKRTPLGPFRFFQEMHPRFVWQTVALACITGDAGADDIFPGSLTAPITRQHMVDIKVAPFEEDPAVLACILISLKDIVAREFDLFLWQAVKEAEHDDSRNADIERDRLEHPRLRISN